MKATEVLFHEAGTHMNAFFEVRVPRLQPGDMLVVQVKFATLGGEYFQVGHEFQLVERTFEQPHGLICTAGNWVVQTSPNRSGVWSSIERMYAEGKLELKRPIERLPHLSRYDLILSE